MAVISTTAKGLQSLGAFLCLPEKKSYNKKTPTNYSAQLKFICCKARAKKKTQARNQFCQLLAPLLYIFMIFAELIVCAGVGNEIIVLTFFLAMAKH